MDRYSLAPIHSLVDQLMRGPRRLRLRQLLGVEFLLSIIEPDQQYPFEFVCHAITGYRPPAVPAGLTRLLDGEPLVSDLVLLAEDISEDAGILASTWPEPLYAVPELADRFDVSTKTIFRWRRRGLSGWKFRVHDRHTRLLFVERCVRRFVARNTNLVVRGSSFSQLTAEERQRIIARATELVQSGQQTANAVARAIAGESGRAVETIRLILKRHDEAHPGAGLFNRSPLQVEADDQRLAVWEAYVDGASIEQLAVRFQQPIASIYRAITQMRARELRARKVEYVGSPDFEAPDADDRILRSAPSVPLRQELEEAAQRVPSGLPPYLANLFRIPLLTPEGEVWLFRKMNYLRYKAKRLIDRLDPDAATAVELDEIEDLLTQAAAVKNEIVQANLRLVVSIAKRHLRPNQDLFELISDGNVSLMRAVDKFDYTRGFKFSTYASWAVMKNFARSIPEGRRQQERYQTGWDELLETFGATPPEEDDSDHLMTVRHTVERMLASLDTRERAILRERFGLDGPGPAQTLEQIGRRFGVSKERVRQLESRAIAKLRSEFAEEVGNLLGT